LVERRKGMEITTDNVEILLLAGIAVLDLVAGMIPDKYVNYVGVARRVISFISLGRKVKK